MSQILFGVAAIALGVVGPLLFFHFGYRAIGLLPDRLQGKTVPFFFVGPAVLLVTLGLVLPTLITILRSFFRGGGSLDFESFVGLELYRGLFADPAIRDVLFNNAIWILVVPTGAVLVGLIVAALANDLKPRWEKVAKSIVFLPMAISFVGAATIWRFVYAFRPEGEGQIGLLNAVVVAFGGSPQAWLTVSNLRLNTLLLTAIMIWLQAGFATVLLSAAMKGVPAEVIEASKVDGASRWQTFIHVTFPAIRPAVVVVTTTIIILVMKVFDIVFAMTGGNFNTDVIVNRFYQELFVFRAYGRASALTVLLVIAVIPIIVLNIRSFRAQHADR